MAEITHINRESDFDFILNLHAPEIIDFPDFDFTLRFFTDGRRTYICSKKGDVLTNLINDNNQIRCVFDNHRLNNGQLQVKLYEDIPDNIYPDGYKLTVTPKILPIELWDEAGDEIAMFKDGAINTDLLKTHTLIYTRNDGTKSCVIDGETGLRTMYYDDGITIMSRENFVTDGTNTYGMRTTYFKKDGSVAWILDASGFNTKVGNYWDFWSAYITTDIAYDDKIGTLDELPKTNLATYHQETGSTNYHLLTTTQSVSSDTNPATTTINWFTGYVVSDVYAEKGETDGNAVTRYYRDITQYTNGKAKTPTRLKVYERILE